MTSQPRPAHLYLRRAILLPFVVALLALPLLDHNSGTVIFLAVAVVGTSVEGWRFRHGMPGPYRDVYERNASNPIVRNLVLVGPAFTLAFAPVLLLIAFPLLGLQSPVDLSFEATGFVIFAGWAYYLLILGLTLVWLRRPPRRLQPSWDPGPAAVASGIGGRFAFGTGVLLVVASVPLLLFAIYVLAGGRPIR